MADDFDAVAVCTECRTQIKDSQAYKDGFLARGLAAACKICGGVMAIVPAHKVKESLDNMDRSRGIDVVRDDKNKKQ